MRTFSLIAVLILLTGWTGAEVPTPMSQVLPADEITTIACTSLYGEYQDVPGWPKNGIFHYHLYLPADYYDNTEHRYPVMFIASPGGNANMGDMAQRLKRDRWIVVMLVESRNLSVLWYPNFVAAHDDLIQRVRVQKDMLFCTGFSGGARVCSAYPGIRPGFQGMILQAAGYWGHPGYLTGANAHITVYGVFGYKDPNLYESRRIRSGLPKNTRSMIEVWEGGHSWIPASVFERALDWVEDRALLEAEYNEDFADAYLWYFTNKLALYEQAQSDIERYTLNQLIQNLPERWKLKLDAPTMAKLKVMDETMSKLVSEEALQREIKAWGAFREALLLDERGRGSNLSDLISLYSQIAGRYANTTYGRLAAIRKQSIVWEAGD